MKWITDSHISHMSAEEGNKMLEELVKGSIREWNDNYIHEKLD